MIALLDLFKKNNFSYAWVIAFAGLFVAGGTGIFTSCLGVFVIPVCNDLGFLRGQFTIYGSISMVISVALMPLYGTLFKRFGFRRIAFACAIICSLTLTGYSFSSELRHFYILAVICGLFMNGFGLVAIGTLINKWFADRKGLATGIAFSGTGLLAAAFIPIANVFIELNGWRWAYRFLSLAAMAILLPVIAFVVKETPEDKGLKPYRMQKNGGTDTQPPEGKAPSAEAGAGLTRYEALRTTAFWLLSFSVLGVTLCQAGPHIHTVSFLSDIGYSASFASAVSSLYFISLTAFKIAIGIAFDRFGSFKGSMLLGAACTLFPVFAMLAGFTGFPWVYAVVLGLASSGATILGPVLTANYFGKKDFSRIFSVVSMFTYIGAAVSSPLYGTIFDLAGTYTFAWIFSMIMGLAVCACLFGSYRASKKMSFAR